jgi:hypothetical protein
VVRAGLALFTFAAGLEAQSIRLNVSPVQADSMSPAPNVTVTASPIAPERGPYSIELVMSRDAEFRQPFYQQRRPGVESGTFTVDSLIPEHILVYIRAQLIDRNGAIVAEDRQLHPVLGWVQLLDPPPQRLNNPTTRRPQFRWASPPITFLWEYDLAVINTRTGNQDFFAPKITANSFTFPDPLEANTSYTWQVTARKQGTPGGGEVTVKAPGTFVISSTDQPTATVAYQNFPNPFGRGISPTTCFWFDLDRLSQVRLMIYSLNLHRVRALIPGAFGTSSFLPGIYGRSAENGQGCDMRFSWDGRDDNGRFVPPGVYIAEFRANGQTTTKKIYFKGP